MIRLEKNIRAEAIEVKLNKSTKQFSSPLVAILMLAREMGGSVNSFTVKQHLLGAMPQRAASNLLEKLARMNYFEKVGPNYHLTEKGNASAIGKAIWEGESAVYRLLLCDLEMIDSPVVYMVTDKERNQDHLFNHKLGNKIESGHLALKEIENKPLKINNTDVIISEIEGEYITYPSVSLHLCVEIDSDKCKVKLSDENGQKLYTQQIKSSISEEEFKRAMLRTLPQEDYSIENNAILQSFSRGDSTEILRPISVKALSVWGEDFHNVEVARVKHQPRSTDDAQRWYEELIFNRINDYLLSDEQFEKIQLECKYTIDVYNSIEAHTRSSFMPLVEERNDFYKLAKLQTIDYLTL